MQTFSISSNGDSSDTFDYGKEEDIIWNSALEQHLQEIFLGYYSYVSSLSGY